MSKVFLIFAAFVLTGCCQTSGSSTLPLPVRDGLNVLVKQHSIPGVYAYDGVPEPAPICKDLESGRNLKKCVFINRPMMIRNIPFFLWTPEGSPAVAIWQSAWDKKALRYHRRSETLIYKGSMYKLGKYRARINNQLLYVWVRK